MGRDTQEGERRLNALRGVVAICLAMFVAVLSGIRGDDSWQPVILVGASLAIGAGLLIYAFRS